MAGSKYNESNYPLDLKLANAYIPWQVYEKKFSPAQGLKRGTIFPELYKPY